MAAPPAPGPDASAVPRFAGPRADAVAVALVAAAVALAHGGSLANAFVTWDDGLYVYDNPRVLRGLTLDGILWAFGAGADHAYFHPVTWVSLMFDVSLFGPGPRGIHGVNLLFQAAGAAALYLLLARTTGRRAAALLAALLWTVHPLTVEAVAWAAERKAVLSTFLALVACHLWVRWAERPGRGRMAAVIAASAAAMLAKPSTVILPGLLLALDLWPLGRLGLRAGEGRLRVPWDRIREKLPIVALAAAVTGLTLISLRGQAGPAELQAPFRLRALHAVAQFADLLGAVLRPVDLAVLRPYPTSVSPGAFAAGLAVLGAFGAGSVLLARRFPPLAFGSSWFLFSMLPFLGFAQGGAWPAWADRFLHLALPGLAVATAFAADAAWRALPRARAAVALGAVAAVVLLGGATRRQVAVWRDSRTLYEHSARVEPRAAFVQHNLGNVHWRQGRFEEARRAYEAALAADPALPTAHLYLGHIDRAGGNARGAEAHYRAALSIDPDLPEPLFALAAMLEGRGVVAEAEARMLLARFLEVAPPTMAAEAAKARARLGR